MQAGRLDRRITIEQKAVTRGPSGTEKKTWTTLAKVSAEVRPKTGREVFTAGQVAGEADTLFRIRWRTNVTVENRIVFDGRKYDITSVAEMGRRQGLEILATVRAE
jgi:SPP1 family predicted phage head-tail adaptor